MTPAGGQAGEFRVAVGEYELNCVPDGLPSLIDEYNKHAALADCISSNEPNLCCVAVRRSCHSWPFLVVAQSFSPAGVGFEPGALLVPETQTLFLGAGERLLAYDLEVPRRLWTDSADMGFWGWARLDGIVVMSAELELAAWTSAGQKLWSTFVEPPWEYRVDEATVHLDVMASRRTFPLRTGPDAKRSLLGE